MINITELTELALKAGGAVLGMVVYIWIRKIILGR